MAAKYYTPSIEEFYVGFELERINQDLLGNSISKNIEAKLFTGKESELNPNDFFRPHLITPVDIQFYFLNPHHIKDFRVKFLDREDIEKCLLNKFILYTFEVDILTLIVNGEIRFKGKCKNTSELKRIVEYIEY